MIVIAIANQKGGVAKSTTCGTLAAGLTKKGYRVLAIDLDPQGNLSDSLGVTYSDHGTYTVLKGQDNIHSVIQKTEACDVLPANIILAGIEQELNSTGRECRLREIIESDRLEDLYDFILCDTPPALGTLTINALVAADYVIVPTTADMSALKGIDQLNMTIRNVKKYFNKGLKIAGILFTKYNPRTNVSKHLSGLTSMLADDINTKVFETKIRSSVVISESSSMATDLFAYKPTSSVAVDYDKFVEEFLLIFGEDK